MKYHDTTITINREEEIKIGTFAGSNLFVRIGFSIDAEMIAEQPQTYDNPGFQSYVNQWLNVTIDENNVAFYTSDGTTVKIESAEMPRYILSYVNETILERAEDTSSNWIDEAIL